MPAFFFAKKTAFFWGKNSTFTQSNGVKAVLERFFSSVFKIKGCCLWKCKFYRLCVRNPASGLLQIGHKSEKWQWRHNWPTWRHLQFVFFNVTLFLLSSLVTGLSFMAISSLVLELWEFSFIRDWPETRKLEIPSSEFCPISGDWDELGIPNLVRIKCQGYSFYRFRVIKGKPTGE